MEIVVALRFYENVAISKAIKADDTLPTGQVAFGQVLTDQLELM